MANVTVTASTSNVNVNSTTNAVNVSTTTSNIVVGTTPSVSDAIIRAAVSGVDPIAYDSGTGVFSLNNTTLLSGQTTTNLTEGTNLYYTNARVQAFIGGTFVTANSNITQSNTALSYSQTLGNSQVIFANSEVAYGGAIFDGGNFAGTGAGNVFYDGANRGSLTGISSKTIPVTSPNNEEVFFGTFQTPDSSFTTAKGLIVHKSSAFEIAKLTPFNGNNAEFTTYASFNNGSSTINDVLLSGGTANVTNLNATGTVTAAYLNGDGSNITGLSTLTNAQAQVFIETNGLTNMAGNITSNANIQTTGEIIVGDLGNVSNPPALRAYIDPNAFTGGATLEANGRFNIKSSGTITVNQNISSDSNIETSGNIVVTGGKEVSTGTLRVFDTMNVGSGPTNTHNITGNLDIAGNITATGNINYQNVTDLYVRDQSITLNANAATDATSSIIINRPVAGANTVLRWNETDDKWQFSNDGSGYQNLIGLTDLSVTQASASGTGTLAYNNGTGVFTYTPPDLSTFSTLTNAQAQAYIQSNGLTMTSAITSNSLISTTGNLQVNADTSINGLKGLTFDNTNNFLGLGTTTPGVMLDGTNEDSAIHIQCINQFHGTLTLEESRATSSGPEINFVKSWYDNGNSAIAAVASGNRIGEIHYEGYDGTAYQDRLFHNAFVDGTVSSGTIPMGWEIRGDGAGTAVNKSMFKVRGNGALQVGNMSTDDSDTGIAFQVDSGGNVEASSIKSTGNLESELRIVSPVGIFNALNINANSISGAQDITASGNVSGTKLTDGVLQITGGNISLIHDVDATGHFHAQEDLKTFAGNVEVQAGSVNITNQNSFLNTAIVKNLGGTELQVGDADNIIISAGSDGVTQKQTFLGTNETVLQTDSVGYAPFVFNNLNPLFGGSGARQNDLAGAASANAQPLYAYVANATVTSGSNTVSITGMTRLYQYYAGGQLASTLFTDAANITTILGEVAVNSIPKTGGLFTMTQAPFVKGTYITAVDAAARTITLSANATANATLTTVDNASATSQNALWIGAGAFNTEVQYAELYVSYADRQGNIADSNYFPQYTITTSLDQFGADKNGFSTSDLTYTTNNPASWTAATYTTSGKTSLSVPDGAVSAPYGLTIGNSTATSYKSFNDISGATFGLNVGWDGLESSTAYGGTGLAIPQIGLASFTDNAFQSSVISNGPRFIYQSRTGNSSSSELDQYPRSGQELGRTVYWGTHGDNPAPSTTAAPGYISFAAADDWTDGSNTNAYFVATSNYTDASSRDPFLSYEKGELIIASGQPTSVQADIRFAPAVQISNNPQNAYDFSSDAAASGSKGWASINYANVTATSGAEVSVNNGMSLGAGTVGDMKITIHRKDNTYALANTDVVVDEFYTGATNSAATGGAQVCDLVGVSAGVTLGSEDRYTFSGITDSNWTFLNGNTYTFASSLFGGGFKQLKNVDGSNVVQGGADRGVAQPSIGQPFVVGVVYRIVSVGTTDFTSIGAADNNIGTTFTASGTGSGSGIGSRLLTGQYTFSNSQASGVTDKKWEFALAEQSENLTLKGNTTTQVTFTDARTEFGSSLHLKDYTTTEINALASPQPGDTVYNTTLNQICFYNGTSWQKVTSATM